MKKSLSLVLALILCMTAVFAFAEDDAAKASKDLRNANALALGETVETDVVGVNITNDTEDAKDFVKDVIDSLVDDGAEAFFADEEKIFVNDQLAVIENPLKDKELVVIATIPMSFDVAEYANLADGILKTTSDVPDLYSEILTAENSGVYAVYTYLAEDGTTKSCIIEYRIEETIDNKQIITYEIPEAVARDAAFGVVNFMKEV